MRSSPPPAPSARGVGAPPAANRVAQSPISATRGSSAEGWGEHGRPALGWHALGWRALGWRALGWRALGRDPGGNVALGRRASALLLALSLPLGACAAMPWLASCGGKPPAQGSAASPRARTGASPAASSSAASARFEGTAPPELREAPPPPGIEPDWHFPLTTREALPNGLELRTLSKPGLPVVELRLVVRSGRASDGGRPGLAVVAGELLQAGGAGPWSGMKLLEHVESLGGDLSIVTDDDSTTLAIGVTSGHLSQALELLAAVALRPRFEAQELTKLLGREKNRVTALSRTSGAWVATQVLYRELFELPTGSHPYARHDALPAELDAITLPECKAWHARHFTPDNAMLVAAGDVSAEVLKREASKLFAAWKGKTTPAAPPPAPRAPNQLEVYLVDRPASTQADIFLGMLGPERKSPEWPALRGALQILGGGVAGRLFLDVREKRSLAYGTGAQAQPLAMGPVPLIVSAGTQTAKAGLTVKALLEHVERLGKEPASAEEVATATRYLSDVFLVSVDTVGALARLSAELGVFGLPDDYYDAYRAEVRTLDARAIHATAERYFRPGHAVLVVAGDAKTLEKPLSHFGSVAVVDADKGFVTSRTIPYDPRAVLELERRDGT